MSGLMTGHDLYWGATDNKGKTTINCSRVWDAGRFLSARREEGAKAKNPEERFIVSVHTEAEYKAARTGGV